MRIEESGASTLAPLNELVYPGRVLLLGRTRGGSDVLAYALTGRSPSSQARCLVREGDGRFRTQVTNPALLAGGNPSLLLYDCIRRCEDHFIVSNGAQTDHLAATAAGLAGEGALDPMGVLTTAMALPCVVEGYRPDTWLDLTRFEPDAPHCTPRISGVLGPTRAAFLSCRHAEGIAHTRPEAVARSYFEAPLQSGIGWFLSTYAGGPTAAGAPLAPYCGEPTRVLLDDQTPEALALRIYDALAPAEGAPDLRVAAAAVFLDRSAGHLDSYICNRHKLAQEQG